LLASTRAKGAGVLDRLDGLDGLDRLDWLLGRDSLVHLLEQLLLLDQLLLPQRL